MHTAHSFLLLFLAIFVHLSISAVPAVHRNEPAVFTIPPSSKFTANISSLFPLGTPGKSWTTCSCSPNPRSLSDATLRPSHEANLPHHYANAPDGAKSMKVFFPRNSFGLNSNPKGGVSFYAPGPTDVDMTTAKEITFGYSLFFEKGFAFNKGGKLPGIYGGNSDSIALGCSGGRRDTRCFSARLMWRPDGAGEMYTYLPPGLRGNEKVCTVEPFSECNPKFGASVGRGSFHFKSGKWTTVTERIKLNDAGENNGELQLFVNGKSVINVKGLTLRNSAAGRMRGIQMQSFFGGHDHTWAAPKDESIYFKDFSVAIIHKL